MSNKLGVKNPSSVVDIVSVVAELVVTGIKRNTCNTSKKLSLLRSLKDLSARSNTTTGNTVFDEAVVVRATVKGNESVVHALGVVVVNVQLLQLAGSRRVDLIVSIINLVCKIREMPSCRSP